MKKIVDGVIKNISSYDYNLKKNYKIFRVLQNLLNPSVFDKKEYEDVFLELPDRKIRTRIFCPFDKPEKRKAIIYIHGGGWVLGTLEVYTKTCLELAKQTNRIVISIDYRLAPEYPFPCGFNDCYDVVELIMSNLDEFGLKEEDVCLMGDSAGGNLTAAVSLKAKKTKKFKLKEQVLIYPAVQSDFSDKTKYKSIIDNGKDYLLTQKQIQDYMSLYVKDAKDLNNPYVSPLKARFPFNQPRTLIITSDKDPLRDEGKAYAKKLSLFGNKVMYHNVEGAMHGFLTITLNKKHKEEAHNKIKEFLGDANE